MNGAKSEEKSLSVSCLPNTKRAATQDLSVTLAVMAATELQHLRAWYKDCCLQCPASVPMQPTMNVARLLNPEHDFEILT